MGTYLATGIVYDMSIAKRKIESKKLEMENIVKSLQKELSMEHYVFNEDEDALSWTINSKMLEGNFSEFLETQYKMYDDAMNVSEVIAKVKEAKTGEGIINLAKERSLYDFQTVDYIEEYSRVLIENSFSDHVPVNYRLMAFFIDGKIIMECYGRIFHYFESAIRLQKEKYPIAACVKTMISG